MTLCAGLCSFQPVSGFCSIRLSEPLLRLRPRSDMVNTLLHEMIHAYVFVATPVRDHEDHGPLFQSHMHRINQAANTKITVFHTFHDEVNSYRKHVWQCNGPCRRTPPYFGFVKRSMNRVPGPSDRWWADHERNCGGTYIKTKEPAEFTAKQAKKMKRRVAREEKSKKKKVKADSPSVKEFFPTIKIDNKVEIMGPDASSRVGTNTLRAEQKAPLSSDVKSDSCKKLKKEHGDDCKGLTQSMLKIPPSAPVIFLVDDHDDAYYLVGDVHALFQTSDTKLHGFGLKAQNRNGLKVSGRMEEQDVCTTGTTATPPEAIAIENLDSDESDSEQLKQAIQLSLLTLPRKDQIRVKTRNDQVDIIEID